MDRRLILVPLALIALGLVAWVVTATPDLRRERPEKPPNPVGTEASAPPTAAGPGATPTPPTRRVVPEEVLVHEDRRYRLDPNFEEGQRADTLETQICAQSQKHWKNVIQRLSDQANAIPEATALEAETVALYDELVFFRKDPEGKDWIELSQKSMRLQEKIRNVESLTDDGDLQDDLDGVKSTLGSYWGQKNGQGGQQGGQQGP